MKYSEFVIQVMRGEGISPSEMEMMLDSAAITSVKGFNRRYHHWLFEVKDGEVVDMASSEMTVLGHGETKMEEECDVCEGEGCKACGWHGQIHRRVV